jgi:hypothetical protein
MMRVFGAPETLESLDAKVKELEESIMKSVKIGDPITIGARAADGTNFMLEMCLSPNTDKLKCRNIRSDGTTVIDWVVGRSGSSDKTVFILGRP